MIKRIAKSFFTIMLLFVTFTCFANYLQSDTFHFKGNNDYPPYQLLDKNSNPSGFSIDILRAIKKTMGLNIDIEMGPWDKVRTELENGQIDGLAVMSYSEERSKIVNFSTPYVYIIHAVFVRKGSEIKSFNDIKNSEVIVVKGDIMHDYLISNNITKYIVPVKDYKTALRLLSAGEYDCALINKLQGQFAINEYNLTNIKPVGTAIQPKEVCFGVKKDNEKLLSEINEGLQIIKSTGEYDLIYNKWFAVYEKSDVKTRVLKIIAWIMIPFLIILLSIIIWSWSLRKQVASKTSELQNELSERKRAEKQLIQEQSLVNSMVNSIPDLIFYKNKDNVYIGCNEAFCKFNNLKAEQIIGKRDIDIFPERQAQLFSNTDLKVINTKEIIQTETWEKHSNGKEVLLFTTKIPFTDAQGNSFGLVGICHDITDRYKTEIDLKNAKDKAEESDRLKSSFLANMSHEIRTPMNAIIGFSDLLVDPDVEDDEREELVTHINNNCNTLLHLIDDIIDLAKIEANELSISFKNTDISNIFNELNISYKETRKNINKEHIDIKIKKELLTNNFHLITDHFRFKQIMINLLNNAFKYTEKGYVEFGYKIFEDKNIVEFFVKDTGIGISSDKHKEIFERFSKIETNNSKLYRGTGLGLTITQNLIARLGGEIRLESEVNAGSIFYFTLPLKYSTKTTNIKYVESLTENKTSWDNKTILIAEDEESNYRFLEMLFKNKGVKLLKAENGYEAIEICKGNDNVDLILMDIKMPGMNGLDATMEIKKMKPNIPVIIQTAYAMQNDERISLEVGCDDYIAKPIKKEKLFSLIDKWFSKQS